MLRLLSLLSLLMTSFPVGTLAEEVSDTYVHQVASFPGAQHTCAIVGSKRELFCWGRGEEGQLGTGKKENSLRPLKVPGLRTVVSVAVGDRHSCAIVGQERELYCWGEIAIYFSKGAALESTTPSKYSLENVLQVSLGNRSICAIVRKMGENLYCWGAIHPDVIKYSSESVYVPPLEYPKSVADVIGASQISLGAGHACVRASQYLSSRGKMICWGASDYGEIGRSPPYSRRHLPLEVSDSSGVHQVTVGGASSCYLTTELGEITCFGGISAYPIESDPTRRDERRSSRVIFRVPVRANDRGSERIRQLVMGQEFICLITKITGTLYCSDSPPGVLKGLKLGGASVGTKDSLQEIGNGVSQVSVGEQSLCAIDFQGRLKCLGKGQYGALGNGNEDNYGDDPHETWDQLPFVEFKDMTSSAPSVSEVEAD